MNGCELAAYVTALAIAIGSQIEDPDELGLVGTVITQLGDTLTTIAAQRAFLESKKSANGENADPKSDTLSS